MAKHSGGTVKRILAYIAVPVVLLALGYGLLYGILGTYIRIGANVLSMFSYSTDLIVGDSEKLVQLYDANTVKVSEALPDPEIDGIPIAKVDMPDSGMYYAQLVCDDIGLDVPLYWDSSEATLRMGAGQYTGSFMPGFGGPLLIGGHNHTYFNCLKDLEVGGVITVDTNYDTYQYEIYDIVTMTNSEFERDISAALGEDDELFMMYTCYPFQFLGGRSTKRIVFYGKRIAGSDVIWRVSNGEQETKLS